jgi:hypothetical protein
MSSITFRVNLETVNRYSDPMPFTVAEADNFRSTRSTFFSDSILANYKLKHDDEFTVVGSRAQYLKRNFTSGTYKFLDIVSEV